MKVLNFVVLFWLLSSTLAWADSEEAAISLDEVDQDFAFQGEYLGHRLTSLEWQATGLQVVALGNGQFAGRQFAGGLPGAGGERRVISTYQGRRENNVVRLEGDRGETIELRGGAAQIYYLGSRHAGRLRKVHRQSPTLGLRPPAGAIVLFAQHQQNPPLDGTQRAPDGSLFAGATTQMPVGDFYMHLEFRNPYMPHARGQERANSGVYIQRRYEVQILDSFGLTGEANECGGLYKQCPPRVNMCLPPLSWQTYDIYFTAARWDRSGKKRQDAQITVLHNGIPIHERQAVPKKTGAGQEESPQPLPIHFQDHGNPVTFRNIWLVPG